MRGECSCSLLDKDAIRTQSRIFGLVDDSYIFSAIYLASGWSFKTSIVTRLNSIVRIELDQPHSGLDNQDSMSWQRRSKRGQTGKATNFQYGSKYHKPFVSDCESVVSEIWLSKKLLYNP
jgi:hypothetical protein